MSLVTGGKRDSEYVAMAPMYNSTIITKLTTSLRCGRILRSNAHDENALGRTILSGRCLFGRYTENSHEKPESFI
jgi:hypothetical protein